MKRCPMCKLDGRCFGLNKAKADGLAVYCKGCAKEKKAAYYQANRRKMNEQVAKATRARQEKVFQQLTLYLKDHPCVDCGETDVEVLECDHVRGAKTGNVVDLIKRSFPWEKIEQELAKCDIRCANCHRRKTNRQFGYRRWAQNLG